MSFDNFDEEPISPAYENGPGYFDYGLCCAGLQSTAPTASGTGIIFEYGTSDSPFSYPANPNLAVGVNPATGTPNAFTPPGGTPSTPQIETYSVLPHMKQPPLYTYSFDMQYALPWQMALTVGYQGSSGFHFLRLVDQNFLYPQSNGTCATGGACTPGVNQTPFIRGIRPNVGRSYGLQRDEYSPGEAVAARSRFQRCLYVVEEHGQRVRGGPGIPVESNGPGRSASRIRSVGLRSARKVFAGGNVEFAESQRKWLDKERARELAGKRRFYNAHRLSVDAGNRRAFGGAGEWGVDDCADAAHRVWARFRGSGKCSGVEWLFE